MTTTEINVKVKLVGELKTQLPSYATSASAGLDLAAHIAAPLIIAPGERVRIPTGIAIQMPRPDLVGLVFARSGLATRHGIAMANGVGVIDADYTGEILCAMQNNSDQPYCINPGDRIAQLVFLPIARATLELVDELSATDRGTGGFGSTGV